MKVTIIGSGVMATSIAQFLSISDEVEELSIVVRSEQKKENINRALNKYFKVAVRREKVAASLIEPIKQKIKITDQYACVEGSDFVLEAVSEDRQVKKDVLQRISQFVSPETIVASNTSSISITGLANEVKHPENFIGAHFFNPATVMGLVEVVSGFHTSDETVSKVLAFIDKLGKQPVVVKDAPGFIVNRMLIPMINEAVCILSEGVSSKEDIDKAMLLGANHPMGPLALSDFIGNDVVLAIMETLRQETGDPKYRPHPLLKKMVRANMLGRKTKNGFFGY
ncbi:MAG: 3-hydroxybutyryl-CoA dehydrogenase [Pseudomonadales bacterium]|nr:3-hydroxybutyryl-CoA dehydrogenase [Pseudomonadales bacterium]